MGTLKAAGEPILVGAWGDGLAEDPLMAEYVFDE